MPQVKVIAVSKGRGRVASASFARDVYPRGAMLSTWQTKGFDEAQTAGPLVLSEAASTRVQRQLVDQNNAENVVTVEDKTVIVLVGANGARQTFRLAS